MIFPQSTLPMTIDQIMKRYGLSYPFVLKKVVSENRDTAYGTVIPSGCLVTFTQHVGGTLHEGYVGQNGFNIMDTQSWVLIESSGSNVIPLDVYKKQRKHKRKIKK
jgi:hypothetical protein